MRELIYGDDARVVAWAEPIADSRFRPDAKAIGIAADGALVGAFIYDTFSSTGCFMHVASNGRPMWLGRDPAAVLTPVFAFPFVQCGFRRVSAVIGEDNTRSQRFVRRLGASLEGRMREAGKDGSDLLLFGMLRRECPWVPAGVIAAERL